MFDNRSRKLVVLNGEIITIIANMLMQVIDSVFEWTANRKENGEGCYT